MNTIAAVPPPWLVTPKLQLREFADADRAELVRMHQDPRVRELLIDDEPLHRHDVVAVFLARLRELYRRHEGLGIWCAQRMVPLLGEHDLANPEVRAMFSPEQLDAYARPQPQFAGWFNLMPMPDRAGEVELGSRLLPSAWGTGLAMEGGEQLLRHAFETLRLPRVWAVCHPRHESVRYCVLSLGFDDLGVQPYDDKPARHFVIEAQAWRAHHQRPRRDRIRLAMNLMRAQEPAAALH
jgi:RimJ/RimL family protein N-acetyltransferase